MSILYDITFDFLIVQELCIFYVKNWNYNLINAYKRHAIMVIIKKLNKSYKKYTYNNKLKSLAMKNV